MTDHNYAEPEKAARKLQEIVNTVEAMQDGRIHIEKINAPFLKAGSPAEYGAGLAFAITRGAEIKEGIKAFAERRLPRF